MLERSLRLVKTWRPAVVALALGWALGAAPLTGAAVAVVEDGRATAGGADTVEVRFTSEIAHAALELKLRFNPEKLSYVAGSLRVDPALWDPQWGEPQVQTFPNGLRVMLISLTTTEANIPPAAGRMLFSVVLRASRGLAPGDTALIGAEGMLTNRQFEELGLTTVPGLFRVIAPPPPPAKGPAATPTPRPAPAKPGA